MPRSTKGSITPRDKEIGRRVRLRRMQIGVTQTQLGDALQLTFQQVQKYEKGTNRIGSGRLEQIAGFLKVPVGYFYDDAPNVEGAENPLQLFTTRGAVQLAQAYEAISQPALKAALLAMAQAIVTSQAKVRR